jgi:hypothetical protein
MGAGAVTLDVSALPSGYYYSGGRTGRAAGYLLVCGSTIVKKELTNWQRGNFSAA